MKEILRKYKEILVWIAAALIAFNIFTGSISKAYAQMESVTLDSSAEPGGGFIAVDERFVTSDGLTRELIMTGLKPENKEQMLACLAEHYREGEAVAPLKVVDELFCDAEKWDNRDENACYDTLQCWAASAANMLWISGWTEYLEYPEGMQPFYSEDEIFQLYNSRFTDRGGDVDKALDWFFMGEFFVTGTKKSTGLLEARAEDGFLKPFVSSLAQHQYDLAEDPSQIRQLVKLGPAGREDLQGQSVFQGSTGSLLSGELLGALHSVTIAGVIIAPEAQTVGDQFKAVIIIDSDNDGVPTDDEVAFVEESTVDDESDRTTLRDSMKAQRTNSYTVYPLQLIKDINGQECWEIVGYSDPDEEYWEPEILYAINELMMPTEELIQDLTEEDGSLDHMNDPDLTLDILFMTGDPEGFTDPYVGRINEAVRAKVTEFAYGEAIRLNYFVSNRSRKGIGEDASDTGWPSLTWRVTRDSDGRVVAEGKHLCELPIYAGSECGSDKPDLIILNEDHGQILPWEPGEYTLSAELNHDHAVKEAYYRNNLPQKLKFAIRYLK